MQRRGLHEDALTELARHLGARVTLGDVLLLVGGLGAGKTTFTRALAQGMEVRAPSRVCSPTFNICMVHEGPCPLVHVDLYRLQDVADAPAGSAAFEALGLSELSEVTQPGNLVAPRGGVLVVEWAELWAAAPGDALRIELAVTPGSEGSGRDLVATAGGPRSAKTLERWQQGGKLAPPQTP